jgi:hypothetical protein
VDGTPRGLGSSAFASDVPSESPQACTTRGSQGSSRQLSPVHL